MADLETWALSNLKNLLRNHMEPQVIESIVHSTLNLENENEVKDQLAAILDLDNVEESAIIRARKQDFIDEFVEKKFKKQRKKRRKKGVKIEFTRNNMIELSKDLQGPIFKQRKLCYCMATQHELVGNCLACGKIICEMEGFGDCMFCGHKVASKGNIPDSLPESLSAAIDQKEKLLEYDNNIEQRLKIIDDGTDWFEITQNPWLSPEDRQMAQFFQDNLEKKQRELEGQIQIKINLEDASYTADVNSRDNVKELQKVNKELASKVYQSQITAQMVVSDDLTKKEKEVYELVMSKLGHNPSENQPPRKSRFSVLQHEDPFEELIPKRQKEKKLQKLNYTEKDDKRQCLTMHQPWASLLINGFKRVEGRRWDSEYRGPLWIHASARRPTPEEIKSVEMEYEIFYTDANDMPSFPKTYPTGVLLGRVELTDVISLDQYQEITPEELQEPTQSPILFVCENPSKLLVPIRMRGDKKIYKLEFDIWNSAKCGLRRVYTGWWPPGDEDIDLYIQ